MRTRVRPVKGFVGAGGVAGLVSYCLPSEGDVKIVDCASYWRFDTILFGHCPGNDAKHLLILHSGNTIQGLKVFDDD